MTRRETHSVEMVKERFYSLGNSSWDLARLAFTAKPIKMQRDSQVYQVTLSDEMPPMEGARLALSYSKLKSDYLYNMCVDGKSGNPFTAAVGPTVCLL